MKRKITSEYITFEENYTLEDLFDFLFVPNLQIKVSDFIKFFRRYRVYLVGIQKLDEYDFVFSFTFPNRSILYSFRDEFDLLTENLPQ